MKPQAPRNVKRRTKREQRAPRRDTAATANRIRALLRFTGFYLAFLGVFLAVQAAFGWMQAQRWFDLQTVDVVGLSTITEEEILVYSQVVKGTPIFSIDTARTQALVEAHPWVKRAPVSRRLPDALVIEVTEYVPVGVVMLDKLYYVDDEGTPFKVAPADSVESFIVIEGLGAEDFEVIDVGRRKVRRSLDVIDHYRAHDMGRLAPLRALRHRYNGLTLSVGSLPTELILGDGNLEEIFQRAAKLWRHLDTQGQQAETMHLDNRNEPERVTVRLRQPESSTTAIQAGHTNGGG